MTDAVDARTVPLLVFDGDCGFCTTSSGWVARRLHRPAGPDALLVPWQRSDLAALGTTAERAQREVLWVAGDGIVEGGAAAFAAWLRFRGGPYGLLGRVLAAPGVRALGGSVYRWVAAHRHQFPGGTPACALPPPGSAAAPPRP